MIGVEHRDGRLLSPSHVDSAGRVHHVPATATGVALGGSNCFGEGTVRVDFAEIRKIR